MSSATLVIANPAATAVDVELVPVLRDGTRGAPVARTIPARASRTEGVTALAEEAVAAVELRARDAAVHATLVLSASAPDGTLLSLVPLTEDPHTARAVMVARAPVTLN